MASAVSLAGTNVAAGAAFQRLLSHPVAWLLWLATALGCGVAAVLLPWPALWATVGISVVLLRAVFALFIHDVFAADRVVPDDAPDTEALAYDIVVRLPDRSAVDMAMLAHAAIHSPRGRFFLEELGVDETQAQDIVTQSLSSYQGDVAAFLHKARAAAPALLRSRITPSVVLATLLAEGIGLPLLTIGNVSLQEAQDIVRAGVIAQRIHERDRVLSLSWMLRHLGGVGRSWVQGYTDALDVLTDDLSARLDWKAEPITKLHSAEHDQALSLLATSTHHNLVLLGRDGIGRHALAERICRSLREQERKASKPETRIVLLKTEQLLSGVRSPDQFLLAALTAARSAGTFVLVCPDLPMLLASGSQLLLPVIIKLLQEPGVHVIGIADPAAFHQMREKNPGLQSLFEEIVLAEPTAEECRDALLERSISLAETKKLRITYRAVMTVLQLSQRFLGDRQMPGKAMDVLADTVELAKKSGETTIREEHIREVISSRARVNVNAITGNEKESLQTLEQKLQSRIIGQQEALRAIVHAIKRARMDIGERKRPVGTFLLLGPTGVGKTYTAQVLAEEYFGTGDSFIRIDLNEFATEQSADMLLSAAEKSPLLRHVHDHPSSLVLLDEIEKAHPKVLHLFLQILDEGRLIDKNGETVDFRNALILATSNAGGDYVRSAVTKPDFNAATFRKDLLAHLLDTRVFTPEFVNRFDEVVAFTPLTTDDAQAILSLHIADIAQKLADQRGITLAVDPACIARLLEHGISPEFGARELRRLLADTLETRIADLLLERDWQRGETMTIAVQDLTF